MVDVMAPVFERLDQEEVVHARTWRGILRHRRRRQANVDQGSVIGGISRRQAEIVENDDDFIIATENQRRDEEDDDKRPDDKQRNGGNGKDNGNGNRDTDNERDDGDDDEDDDDEESRPTANQAPPPPPPPPAAAQSTTSTTSLAGVLTVPPPPPPTLVPLLTTNERTTTPPPPQLTPLTSSSTSTSTLVPLSSSPAGNPVAANPQVSLTPLTTLTPATTTPSITPTSTPLAAMTTSSSPSTYIPLSMPTTTTSATAVFENTNPAQTIVVSATGDGDRREGDHRDGGDRHPPPGALSPTAEDVLISAGSIGAFILLCFVFWMGWRTLKRSKRAKEGGSDSNYSTSNTLLSRIPYFGGRFQKGWQDLDDSASARGQSPMYEQTKSSMMATETSIYASNASTMASSPIRRGPTFLPQLDTNVSFSPINPYSASTMGSSLNTFQSATSPQGVPIQATTTYIQQPQAVLSPPPRSNLSPAAVVNNPFASPEDAYAPNDLTTPSSAVQYGNDTMQTFQTTTTDRSRMPDPFYNQSELARQASTAYDPAKRAVYRASELSSISSGFGDGDIIVPVPAGSMPDVRPLSYSKTPSNLSRANSIAGRSATGQVENRDTIYTTTSEDVPARYRSVNSWVNQQTGRVQREQQRSGEDVPPVPALPAEDRLTLMMDDGEEPRRYEDTLSSQLPPPVPVIPLQLASGEDRITPPSSTTGFEESKSDHPGQPSKDDE